MDIQKKARVGVFLSEHSVVLTWKLELKARMLIT